MICIQRGPLTLCHIHTGKMDISEKLVPVVSLETQVQLEMLAWKIN